MQILIKSKKNLDDYEDKWKWATLTTRLDHDFIVENLPEYYLLWDWGYIIESVLTEEDLAKSELRIQIAIILSMLEKKLEPLSGASLQLDIQQVIFWK